MIRNFYTYNVWKKHVRIFKVWLCDFSLELPLSWRIHFINSNVLVQEQPANSVTDQLEREHVVYRNLQG